MFTKKKYSTVRIFAAITFLIAVVTNGLANILPINGQTTGDVSDAYANLFTPATYAFSIWGLIYALLFVYTIYQLNVFGSKNKQENDLLDRIAILFSVSSIANALWIVAWHYEVMWLALILISTILICLIFINREIRKTEITLKQRLLVKVPFSIYFGWITVATIANATVFLVSINWQGFGISESIWTIIILFVGFLIATATIIRNRSIGYALTIIWSYTAILVQQSSQSGFNGAYPSIISAVSIFIAFLIIVILYTLFIDKKKNKYS